MLVSIINEAAWAAGRKRRERDRHQHGPEAGHELSQGPLEWAEEIGYAACGELLDALNEAP